mmetsp:Transcript_25511/g.61348  ORF Transcript_25511/g.61348 Transcript_25511/m.61348 type:complete len:886 (-) Transcript_25511:178-2835(-)|eukprot:CAMPEP_0181110096 /NCGR_PEP_ID=MMETSP1071-20121207/18532_1 /TAXON_ID=35127 /ORGANISM="Thalassiosira sp., Strain NH16" /LENGTH=885 /DNA_ID=CAMNT_0023193845 /DNA_START=221 /DNA_END=2878 /DNA_ORIENTATION=+
MIKPSTIRSIWKVTLAVTALLEIQYISLVMRKVDDSVNDPESDEYCRSLVYFEDDEFSINYSFIERAWESTITISQLFFVWVGPFFCSLCLVEALVRAVEARMVVLHNRALDDFEKTLLRAAQTSSVRLSMFFLGSAADQDHKKRVSGVTKVLRSWIPPIATIAFWLFILPTNLSDFHHPCGSVNLNDSAVVTQWIDKMSLSMSEVVSAFHSFVESFFWTKILPYRIHKQPQRFIQRLQAILRLIRFVRFAGPLFRMGLKLQDQVRAFWKARHQSRIRYLEKQRRIDKPSMLFTDIQHLFQLAKKQTALARIPSFMQTSPRLNTISSSVMETYNKRRVFGKEISKQLSKLQGDYLTFGNDSFTTTSDLYDRVVKISQDITTSIHSEKRKYSNRYVKFLRSLLSSREHLISPRTRFSIAWRMTVTNCLLLEIARLCASWHLSETFTISLSQIVGRLFVNCKEPEQMKNHLAFITDQINGFRQHIFDMFPLFGPPPVDIAVCVPNGPQALLVLHLGRMLEFFVDAVVFMDIFVWFLTGDIDVDTHAIIPKPFFTRCILPGTLVQVLDHPTLPDLLPSLLKSTLVTFATIGYSRCIRWILAVVPALKMLVLDPMAGFFFKHIEEDEGLMHYAESVGMLTPERKPMSYGSAGSLGAASASSGHRRHLFSPTLHKRDSDAFNTSQVGLFFDASPVSSRSVLGSMLSTDGSSDGLDRLPLPPSLLPPSFSGMPMENSPLKKRDKSVHFGLLSNAHNNPQSASNDETDKISVGYSLSSHELHADEPTTLENTVHNKARTSEENIEPTERERSIASLDFDQLNDCGNLGDASANDGCRIRNDPDNQQSTSNDEIDKNSVGYSLSPHELHAAEHAVLENTTHNRACPPEEHNRE